MEGNSKKELMKIHTKEEKAQEWENSEGQNPSLFNG